MCLALNCVNTLDIYFKKITNIPTAPAFRYDNVRQIMLIPSAIGQTSQKPLPASACQIYADRDNKNIYNDLAHLL